VVTSTAGHARAGVPPLIRISQECTVTPSALIRASGLAAIVGGIGFVLFPLLHPNHDAAGYTSAIWVPAHMTPNVGAILILFGLTGLLARQLQRAGLFGVIGYVAAFVGTASFVMGAMIEAYIIPFMGLQNPALEEGPPPPGIGEAFLTIAILMTVGYILLGIATYRAGVLPRSVGLLLVIGAVVMQVTNHLGSISPALDALWGIGPVLQGASLVWLGYALWTMTPDVVVSGAGQGAVNQHRLAPSMR
jgi:hypothetical protein